MPGKMFRRPDPHKTGDKEMNKYEEDGGSINLLSFPIHHDGLELLI